MGEDAMHVYNELEQSPGGTMVIPSLDKIPPPSLFPRGERWRGERKVKSVERKNERAQTNKLGRAGCLFGPVSPSACT